MLSCNEKDRWDRAAPDYQAVCRLGINDYNEALLRFWEERGMLRPGARVLDIGCGVGKYGTYLAERGCAVTLTDISGEMLRRAGENMARFETPWTLYEADFDRVTGREPVFAGGFELVISTMSPAIHDLESVRKMSALSRGWCFLTRFHDWAQPTRDALMRAMGMTPRARHEDLPGDCASITAAVREAGFQPEICYVNYNWADERTPEEMADYLCRNYFDALPEQERLRGEALRAARALCPPGGTLRDEVRTRVAWIFWTTMEEA